ncbi:MAG: glycosyltransferase family 2 protein [Bacteroidales bacterium]|nr:glycosyltransferase family 2 protein [Bacteroidales bacterium]
MQCFDTYYNRFNVFDAHIKELPNPETKTIVVIPSYNEPNIAPSLLALLKCKPTQYPVEVIVVVNSPENASEEVLNQNQSTIETVNTISSQNTRRDIKIYCIHRPNLPKKHAGVGFARKIGMDEAVRRFDQIENKSGIIVNFDADSLCNYEYLYQIEQYFIKNPKKEAISIYFEHPLEGEEYPQENYKAIAKYELYLRYYLQAQKYSKFPFAYHTIGSAFAVKAYVYTAEGGMNRRQAGEDFYFLQKIIPRQRFGELNTAQVYPSPRCSIRVPFGTGASITKMCTDCEQYLVYNPEAFEILKRFFETAHNFRTNNQVDIDSRLKLYLEQNDFFKAIDNMKNNSTTEKTFMQRFFTWFDAFRLLKFLNYIHENQLSKIGVEQASLYILNKIGISEQTLDTKQLLKIYREIELKKQK